MPALGHGLLRSNDAALCRQGKRHHVETPQASPISSWVVIPLLTPTLQQRPG
jgi:hypothetical protein